MNFCTYILLISLCFISANATNSESTPRPPSIEECFSSLQQEISLLGEKHSNERLQLQERLNLLDSMIRNTENTESLLNALKKKLFLNDSIRNNFIQEDIKTTHIRYLKGVQIIRALYEKTLALDHHYTSIQTLQSVQRMTNPNNYPEYVNSRERIISTQSKKNKLELKGILGDNLYTSVVHSLFNLFTSSSMNSKRKDTELLNMECIIDFTLKMNTDLSTISFEMDFLRTANEDVMKELETMFIGYLKPIGNSKTLENSRKNDTWGELEDLINIYFEQIEKNKFETKILANIHSRLSDFKFSIDLLYFFIHRYNQLIKQSISFYKKFKIMIDNYKNSNYCIDRIPQEFMSLKESIDITITKFHKAYNPVEINGSQLKQLLYGSRANF